LAQDVVALPVGVSPTDSSIRYLGRFDRRDADGPRCAWSGSTIELKFLGTALNVRLKEKGNDRFQVVVDGIRTKVIATKTGTALYSVAEGLPGAEHTVQLVKRTEPLVGTTQILGFQINEGGRLLTPGFRPVRTIEVIGDSISCGYGNEGKSASDHFTPDSENAYMTYGAIVARKAAAEYLCVAWSGRKLWPDNTITDVYERTLPVDPESQWNFASTTPDVVVINLGTNDFRERAPERGAWTTAYLKFIAKIRQNYPKALIYCASGSMMTGKPLETLKEYLHMIVIAQRALGDLRIRELHFEPQLSSNGFGSDFHPSVRTHELMADKLMAALRIDQGW
jgi:lysophospholipase L1-like esterase